MCVCVCVVDGKTNMLESNQKELGQQVIIVNDNLKSFANKAGNKFENGVSKSDTIDNSSDIENRNVVEVRVFSDHNEREYRGSLKVEYEQRAKFSCGIGEEKASPVLLEDKSSSIVVVEDKRSSKCQVSCLYLSGRARWFLNNVTKALF